MKRIKIPEKTWPFLGFAILLLIALYVAKANQSLFFVQGYFDSYAQQALAWRAGQISLPENIPNLELAIYEGKYYVSFPPVPTIPLWILSFFVEPEQIPSGFMTLLYFLLCYPFAYALSRQHLGSASSAAFSVFLLVGGSLLDVAVSAYYFTGGVWYQAQTLGLFFTLSAFYAMRRKEKVWHVLALISIALAVGCRPFQALYVPFLLRILFQKMEGTPFQRLLRMLPFCVIPFLIGCAYGLYNLARFDSFFEFGHNFLPEFSTQGGEQFALHHIPENFLNILRAPFLVDGMLMYPITLGFAFYWTNPMITTAFASCIRRKLEKTDWILICLTFLHALALLSHRTFGGWQYGTRYLCDLLPALLLLRARSRQHPGLGELGWMGAMTAFNLWGSLTFHLYSILFP